RHHDGAQPQQRSFEGRGADILLFEAQLIDVGNQNYGSFDRDAHQSEQAEYRGNAEGGVREFERDKRADRLGEQNAEADRHWEFEVAIEREKNHENDEYGE